jgi:hypothetical protein
MRDRFPYGDPQLPRAVSIENGPRPVAEKPARHRRTACRNRQRIQQSTHHLVYLRLARHDGFTIDRHARIAHGGWPTSLYQEVLPALGQCATRNRCDEHVSPGGQEWTRLGRPSLCELAIEVGSEQSAHEPGPTTIASSDEVLRVVSIDEKKCRASSATALRLGVRRSPCLASASWSDPSLVARPVMANRSKELSCRHHAMMGPDFGLGKWHD